jgi:exodeoxyribonuclease VII large subunit
VKRRTPQPPSAGWDLFTASEEDTEPAVRLPPREEVSGSWPSLLPDPGKVGNSLGPGNEELAHTVASQWMDAGTRSLSAPGEGWSVSAVNAAARELIEGVLPPLWIVGEVTNFTRARSGHCYFSLRDAQSQIRCVMWRDEARRLPTTPAEGMQVRVLGRVTIYEARGEFQLVVSDLEGKGDGLWKLAFDRLRTTLDVEGLLSPTRKRALPRCPARIGIVTSPSGAALRDILSVVRRRAPWTQIVLCGCRVQGDGAAEEIARAIRRFAAAACADVLIIGRGGGSIEDLWAFNEEVVARAIADSPIPTISAVGHETDVTIADLVCDLRAPTPSAAAEAAVPDGATLRRDLRVLRSRLSGGVGVRIADARAAITGVRTELHEAAGRRVSSARDRASAAAGRLQALSPLSTLARGFAVPLRRDGTALRRVAEFGADEPFQLRVVDGVVACRTETPAPPVQD